MAYDRIKEILQKDFSELTEELYKELQELISASAEAEKSGEEEKSE